MTLLELIVYLVIAGVCGAIVVVTIGGHPFPIVWSIVGGIALVAIAHAMMGPRFANRFVR